MGGRQVGSRRQRAGSGLRSRAEPQPGTHTAAEQRTPNQTVGPVLGESESEEKERRRQRDGEGERDRETEAGTEREREHFPQEERSSDTTLPRAWCSCVGQAGGAKGPVSDTLCQHRPLHTNSQEPSRPHFVEDAEAQGGKQATWPVAGAEVRLQPPRWCHGQDHSITARPASPAPRATSVLWTLGLPDPRGGWQSLWRPESRGLGDDRKTKSSV